MGKAEIIEWESSSFEKELTLELKVVEYISNCERRYAISNINKVALIFEVQDWKVSLGN